MYTFGDASNSLPVLPIVAGFRVCDGTEDSILDCVSHNDDDPGCANGCGETCTHAVDQGAICSSASQVGQRNAHRKRLAFATGALALPLRRSTRTCHVPAEAGCLKRFCKINHSHDYVCVWRSLSLCLRLVCFFF